MFEQSCHVFRFYKFKWDIWHDQHVYRIKLVETEDINVHEYYMSSTNQIFRILVKNFLRSKKLNKDKFAEKSTHDWWEDMLPRAVARLIIQNLDHIWVTTHSIPSHSIPTSVNTAYTLYQWILETILAVTMSSGHNIGILQCLSGINAINFRLKSPWISKIIRISSCE